VLEWTEATLSSASHALRDALRSPGGMVDAAGGAPLARVAGLAPVLEALSRLPGAGGPTGRLADARRKAALLSQALAAADWSAQHRLAERRAHGRHPSAADFARAVEERRRRAAGDGLGPLFGDDLVAAAAAERPYPFASLQDAIAALFLGGGADEAAALAKRSALLFWLLDAEWLSDPEPLARSLGVPPPAARQLRALHLLDLARGAAPPAAAALAADAAALLMTGGGAGGGVPFKALQALAALRQPEAALALHRAAAGGASAPPAAPSSSSSSSSVAGTAGEPPALEQAATLLRVRLQLGLLPDAFLHARASAAAAPAGERGAHVRTLTRAMLAWAAGADGGPDAGGAAGRLGQLLRLPFSQEEEAEAVAWLASAAPGRLPAYFAQRGRFLEALAAYQTALRAGAPLPAACREVMAAAAAALPPAARRIAVAAPGGGAPMEVAAGLLPPAAAGALPLAVMQSTAQSGIPPPFFGAFWGRADAAAGPAGGAPAPRAAAAAEAAADGDAMDFAELSPLLMSGGGGAGEEELWGLQRPPGSMFLAPPPGFFASGPLPFSPAPKRARTGATSL